MIAHSDLRIEPIRDTGFWVGESLYDFSSSEERDTHQGIAINVHSNSIKYHSFPYVWGGNSPSVAIARLRGMTGRRQMQGSWRVGQPLVPGFDCSGWVQYNFRSVLNLPRIRKVNCSMFKNHAKAHIVFSEGVYSASDLREASRPGDLLFLSDPERQEYGNHVAIVLGGGMLSESAGEKTPDYANISEREWAEWRSYANIGSNGMTDLNRGGIQMDSLDKYEGKKSSLYRFDF